MKGWVFDGVPNPASAGNHCDENRGLTHRRIRCFPGCATAADCEVVPAHSLCAAESRRPIPRHRDARYNRFFEEATLKSFPTLALACALVGLAPGQSGLPTPQPAKLQVLIVTGQNTTGHDWRSTTPVLRKILEDTGRFEVRVTEEFRGAGANTLAPYDVVLVNYYENKHADLRWGDSADNALLNFVRSGKGLVVYHFSLAAFDGWTEYEKLCAGNWRPNNGHHSARHDFTVTVQDRDHPITRGLKTTFAEASDELYANLKWQPAGTLHVLATAWDDHSLYRQGEKQPLAGPGAAEPMLWTVNYGQGRVFVTALGHDTEAMKNAGFAVTLARGTEWAASGKVTIAAPPSLAATQE